MSVLWHREAVGGLWDEMGRLQFDFLVAQGLQPHHKMLDIGCGSMRGGRHFVNHLERETTLASTATRRCYHRASVS